MTRGLLDYEALSFDCYGTLIDWESGIWDALQPLLWANDRPIGRADVLAEFGRLETLQQRETPRLRYPELLAKVHHDLAGALGLASTEALDSAFGASVTKCRPVLIKAAITAT